jgi:hypothetical protein
MELELHKPLNYQKFAVERKLARNEKNELTFHQPKTQDCPLFLSDSFSRSCLITRRPW